DSWQDNDLYEARRDALRGQIKLKKALAIVEQDQATKRIAAATADLAKAEDEYGRLAKELQALQEQVALYRRLQEEQKAREGEQAKMSAAMADAEKKAAAERDRLAQQLSAEQQKSAASEKVAAAELALKTADTVEAGRYAKAQYDIAAETLKRAQKEFGD